MGLAAPAGNYFFTSRKSQRRICSECIEGKVGCMCLCALNHRLPRYMEIKRGDFAGSYLNFIDVNIIWWGVGNRRGKLGSVKGDDICLGVGLVMTDLKPG